MTIDALSGLAPVAIDLDEGVLHLVAVGTTRFSTAFYDETVTSIGEAQGTVTMPIDEVRRLFDRLPRPSGLIFHVGRCGSTLVQRMLAQDPGLLIIGEPLCLSQVEIRSDDLTSGWDDISLVLGLFEHLAASRRQRSVIRLIPWQCRDLVDLGRALPDAASVFIWREPVEVVGSNVATPPPWMSHGHHLQQMRSLVGVGEVDPVELDARLWTFAVEHALAAGEELLVIDYADLLTNPAAVVDRVLAHLSADVPIERALRELRYYSKAASRNERFEPAGRHQRATLAPTHVELVHTFTEPSRARIAERTWRPDLGARR